MTTVAAVVGLASFAFGSGQDAAGSDGRGSRARELGLVDIAGSVYRPFDDLRVRAVVLVFIVTDCPISNAYLPELNRLHSECTGRAACGGS